MRESQTEFVLSEVSPTLMPFDINTLKTRSTKNRSGIILSHQIPTRSRLLRNDIPEKACDTNLNISRSADKNIEQLKSTGDNISDEDMFS